MAKKQSDYLADLLAEDAAEPLVETKSMPEDRAAGSAPSPAPSPTSARAGMSLLGRESALARVASGEVRQVTQLMLDPARVRIWAGNARLQARLSEETVRDLIDSIIAEGGQKVPAVVRRISDDPAYDYEVIAGTRRHFAISWLRANSYPDMKLIAQVADLDDEAAFRLADLENRARKDVSDIERARNYADAVGRHYGGRAVRMAERLNLSKGWLSKMLKAASLPNDVVAAFADLSELTLNPAYALANAMENPSRTGAIRAEAAAIVAENDSSQAAGHPPLPGAAAYKRLMTATTNAAEPATDYQISIDGQHGRPILSVKSVTRQGVTLHLPAGSGASDDQLKAALQTALETLRMNGVSLA